jgi:glycosyltransferase involved in cell wall biosynthesis
MVEQRTPSLSVFFPCHDEQENIEALTHKTLEVLATVSEDFEVILVNDGSGDRTGALADQLADAHEAVKVVHHRVNRGYGGALQSGFRAATKEWVFYTDGDGQFDIGELPLLLPLIPEYDIVTCYRKNRQDAAMRRLLGWGWGKLINLLFGLKIRDIDCAFKLYRREIFDRIKMESNGALIDAEILARAHRAGFSMTQIPVTHYPRTAGDSSGANLKVVGRAFKELFQLRKKILSE